MRRSASQEGNALYSLLALGLADERCDELARRLVEWQWPDGGWNCDRHRGACNSSYHESLIPLRALSLHAARTGNSRSRAAAEKKYYRVTDKRVSGRSLVSWDGAGKLRMNELVTADVLFVLTKAGSLA